jgi:uncharacterized Zn-finger protein
LKFRQKYDLNCHKNRVHLKIKPFRCNYDGCDRRFNRKRELKIHSCIHSAEKPYICTYNDCNKTFSQSFHLKFHINRHLNINKYKSHSNK